LAFKGKKEEQKEEKKVTPSSCAELPGGLSVLIKLFLE
jgi:hypothetical protein